MVVERSRAAEAVYDLAMALSLGERLRHLRRRANMTQRDLAERSGVAQNAISRIERGVNQPQPATVSALAGALDTSVGTLLGDLNLLDPELLSLADRYQSEVHILGLIDVGIREKVRDLLIEILGLEAVRDGASDERVAAINERLSAILHLLDIALRIARAERPENGLGDKYGAADELRLAAEHARRRLEGRLTGERSG